MKTSNKKNKHKNITNSEDRFPIYTGGEKGEKNPEKNINTNFFGVL